MSEIQRDDLVEKLEQEFFAQPYDLEFLFAFEQRNITWAATTNAKADETHNVGVWVDLNAEFDVIAGVFPPVALASRRDLHGPVYSPVSIQSEARETGSTKSPTFVHAYWVMID